VEGLSLTYSDGTEAVQELSLTIPRGEFFGFLGANGAGKTTTIKMLSTLLAPTGGQAHINGYDVEEERTAVRGTVGYMAQHVSVDRELTARENLQFACEAYGVGGADREARIEELLELVDLADVADTPAGNFSGGMQKRLDAATALVHDPALVFLDEPTTGLDPKARNRLWDYFERINDAGTTIFLTTQYLEEADALCDRLAVIRDGGLVADDSPEALKRRVGSVSTSRAARRPSRLPNGSPASTTGSPRRRLSKPPTTGSPSPRLRLPTTAPISWWRSGTPGSTSAGSRSRRRPSTTCSSRLPTREARDWTLAERTLTNRTPTHSGLRLLRGQANEHRHDRPANTGAQLLAAGRLGELQALVPEGDS
jgi:ABC-type multidrug transport system ATPase subunit